MSSFFSRAWSWLKPPLFKMAAEEPAMLRARYAQVVSVLAAIGLTVPHVVDYRVGVALGVWGVLAPWLQGKRTRADVWAPQTVQDLTDLAAEFPGLAHDAEGLLAAGWSKWDAYVRLGHPSRSPEPQAAPESAPAPAAPELAPEPAPPAPQPAAPGIDPNLDVAAALHRLDELDAEAQAAQAAQAAPAGPPAPSAPTEAPLPIEAEAQQAAQAAAQPVPAPPAPATPPAPAAAQPTTV